MTMNTEHGFYWGPMTVTRLASDDRGHYLSIQTDRGELVVAVTPSGFIRTQPIIKSKLGKGGDRG
jgi:hypothetical protein